MIGSKYERNFRRKKIASLEVNRMCVRYESECKELGTRMETEEEREERLQRKQREEHYKKLYQLHI